MFPAATIPLNAIPDPSALPTALVSVQLEIAEVSANAVSDLYVPEAAVITADPEFPVTTLPTSPAAKVPEENVKVPSPVADGVKVILE